ncbi:sigma factor-like helix-turn-helix DNA-binding protein [Fusobacterium mortiferum]|uniref:sigma factor-like helix-turn-helix DNA-binding protein n=1 Tax=Fusobacterium mortiferum TaxID=850 RepID=UPI00345D7853
MSCREVEVYKLFHYKGLNHREIATLLNIKRTTSRNYLYRANKKIRKISKKMEDL